MEKTINSSLIYKGKVITIYKDDVLVEKNGGINSIREVVHHNGGVVGLVKTKDRKIKFVRQYRYVLKEKIIELPAGKIEIDEDPDVTIYRELIEEVGVKSNKMEYLGKMYVSPGYCDEAIHMYYVDDYEDAEQDFDEDEDLDVVEIDVEEAFEMIKQGKIVDAKTVCLLLLKKEELLKK